jgi:phosphoenolpyruvate carboxykinase (ATP)
LPLFPHIYADLLKEKIARHQVSVWLINTGWTGGAYGVGERIRLPYTRAMIKAALNHGFDGIPMRIDPIFNLATPTACPDVPAEVLDPSKAWENQADYETQARNLAQRFTKGLNEFQETINRELATAGTNQFEI